MENEFENKVEQAMKKFVGKCVKIIISGVIESKFYMKNLKYEIEEGILVIEDGDDAYLDVDIDDVEDMYSEYTSNGYALLTLRVGRDLQIEIQTPTKLCLKSVEIGRGIYEKGIDANANESKR